MTGNEQFEKILEQAFAMHENGKPVSEILAAFKGYQVELKEIFAKVEALSNFKQNVAPSEELLRRIISQLEPAREDVTEQQYSGYIHDRGLVEGRSSVLNRPLRVTESLVMNLKIWLPVGGIVAILVLLFVAAQIGTVPTVTLADLSSDEAEIDRLSEDLAASINQDDINLDEALEEGLAWNGEGISSGVGASPVQPSAQTGPKKNIDIDSDFNEVEKSFGEIDSSLEGINTLDGALDEF